MRNENLKEGPEENIFEKKNVEKKHATRKRKWKRKEDRKRQNKIMQMRFLCGAYAFCILHFSMYGVYWRTVQLPRPH